MIKTIAGFSLDEIYTCAYVAHFGASFETFFKDPLGTLEAIDQSDAIAIMLSGYRPLLPKQKRLQQINEAQWKSEGHDVAALRTTRDVVVEVCHEPADMTAHSFIDLPPMSEPISQVAPSASESLDPSDTWRDHTISVSSSSLSVADFHSSMDLFEGFGSINPTTGLPMLPGGMVDVTGTPFGCSPTTFDWGP